MDRGLHDVARGVRAYGAKVLSCPCWASTTKLRQKTATVGDGQKNKRVRGATSRSAKPLHAGSIPARASNSFLVVD